jgi:hypothetical protein
MVIKIVGCFFGNVCVALRVASFYLMLVSNCVSGFVSFGRLACGWVAWKAEHECALQLIITLVVVGACGWQLRIAEAVTAFPLLLLFFLCLPPHVVDPKRQVIAQRLLESSSATLDKFTDDFTLKLREWYRVDFAFAAETGKCTVRLFVALIIFRSRLPFHTQDIEGRHSLLQVMANRSRTMALPLANSRMKIKFGNVTPDDCASVHQSVVAYMRTDEFIERSSAPRSFFYGFRIR